MKVGEKSVARSATLLGYVLLLILVALTGAAAAVVIWLFVDAQQIGHMLAAGVGYESDVLKTWQAFALTLILLVQIGIWIAVVSQGRQIFTALTRVALNDASVVAGKAARLLWAMLAWGIAGHTIATVVATWHFPEGMKALEVSVGSTEISIAIAALLASFMSRAFVLGAALWQDHQEVI
jgi:magnesium-transporting ATPase (P-type)